MKSSSKLAIVVIGGGVLLVLLFMLVLKPVLGQVNKLTVESNKASAEIERLDQQITAYKIAKADLSKAVDKKLLYDSIATDKTLYLPIERIEAAAASTGTVHDLKILRDTIEPGVETVKVKKVTEQTELEEIPYVISARNNSYVRLVTFIEYLEHVPYFNEISQIEFYIQEDEVTGSQSMNATIHGVFFTKLYEPEN